MKKMTTKKKRSKIFGVFFFPIFACIFISGWFIFSIGGKGNKVKEATKETSFCHTAEVELKVIPLQTQENSVR
jgi:hypothetical protein